MFEDLRKELDIPTFVSYNGQYVVLKSSATVNTAGAWASQGKRVLIIDMDNQGNSILSFGQNPDSFEYTTYDVLVDGD